MSRSSSRPPGSHTPGLRSRSPVALALLLVSMPAARAHSERARSRRHLGTVTDRNGAPLPGISVSVTVYIWDQMFPQVVQVAWGGTDATGAYQTGVVPHGEHYWGYFVCFTDSQGVYASECHDDVPFSSAPMSYGTAVLSVAQVDAVLEPAGSISGRMTSATGGPVQGEVTLYGGHTGQSSSTFQVSTISTDHAGCYTFDRLKSGTYRLHFWDPDFDYGYPAGSGEFWDDVAEIDVGKGHPVVLAPGESVTGIDETVGPEVKNVVAPTISGTAQVGQTLTASGDSWLPEDATVTYRWVVGSDSVPGDDPTGPTYVPTAADIGRTIRVHATGAHPSLPTGSCPVDPHGCRGGSTRRRRTAPTAGGGRLRGPAPHQGHTRGRPGGPGDEGRLAAHRGDVEVPLVRGAKGHRRRYAPAPHPTPKFVGKRLTVRVRATAPGHPKATVWTKPTSRVTP